MCVCVCAGRLLPDTDEYKIHLQALYGLQADAGDRMVTTHLSEEEINNMMRCARVK